MTTRNVEYSTKDDNEDLNELMTIMHSQHKVFEDCAFTSVSTKTFNNCQFINCTFGDVGASTFSNCVFDAPKFYESFHGIFYNCNISNYYGHFNERRPL